MPGKTTAFILDGTGGKTPPEDREEFHVTELNETTLNELVGRVLGDLGGAVSVPLVRIGDALGLYRTLKEIGPAKVDELADAAGCAPRYVREWLAAQAASGYVHYERGRFSLTPEQALVFAEPDSPVNLIGAFDTAAAMVENQPKVQSAFKTGRGVAWGDQAGCMFCAVARLFRQDMSMPLCRSGCRRLTVSSTS